MYLVVSRPFEDYVTGNRITSLTEITRILASIHAGSVIKAGGAVPPAVLPPGDPNSEAGNVEYDPPLGSFLLGDDVQEAITEIAAVLQVEIIDAPDFTVIFNNQVI